MSNTEQHFLTVCELSKFLKEIESSSIPPLEEQVGSIQQIIDSPGNTGDNFVNLIKAVKSGFNFLPNADDFTGLKNKLVEALDAAEIMLMEQTEPEDLSLILSTLYEITGEEPETDELESICTAVSQIAQAAVFLDGSDKASIKKTSALLQDILSQYEFPPPVKEKLDEALGVFNTHKRKKKLPETIIAEINGLIEAAVVACEEFKNENIGVVLEEPESALVEKPSQSETEETVTESYLEIDPLLLKQFEEESLDLLEKAEMSLLELEKNPEDNESLNTAFRSFHTIKGTASFLSLTIITDLAHKAEDILHDLRDKKRIYTNETADLVLKSVDTVKSLLSNVQEAIPSNLPVRKPAGYDDLINRLSLLQSSDGETDQPLVPVKQQAVNKKTVKPVIRKPVLPKVKEEVPETTSVTKEESKSVPVPESTSTGSFKKTDADSSIRIRTEKLDRLIDMVGELVIAQSMISQDEMLEQSQNFGLLRKVSDAGKIVRELQDLSLSMRMVTLKSTFQKMSRLVRDVAYKSGKDVMLIIDGEETEIDRNMVNVLNDPLIHLIRNAVDHGIEDPKERKALGKTAIARINISAESSGGNIIVTVKDDGKGLQKEKIIARAVERGLISSGKGMSEAEIYNLIFAPGFSTKEEITDLSGRGVGLDVVKKNIELLRGSVDCVSEPGMGSIFHLRLPLTLAITDGMVMKVGNERYILPTVNIKISVKPDPEHLNTVAGKGELYTFRGDTIPVIRLHRLLNIEGAILDPTEGLFVIIEEGGRQFALLIDELVGQNQVVIKNLGSGMKKVPGISGGAILGDGKVGLILDARGLVDLMFTESMKNRNYVGETQ